MHDLSKHGCFLMALICIGLTGCAAIRTKDSAVDAPPAEIAQESQETELDEAFEQIHLLTQTIMHIRRSYIDEDQTDYQALIYGALHGMLDSLDPYSQFLEPEDYQALRENATGEFGGIGITISMRNNVLTVIAPMEDTPAFGAGILAGDRIVEIDDKKTDGMSLAEAVRKLRGEVGESVRLGIMRGEEREIIQFELERDIIRVFSVRGVRMLTPSVGYIRLVQFSEPTADNLRQEMDRLLEDGMQGLVLDLRNNSGGLLAAAIQVSQLFLPRGALIVTTRGRGGRILGEPVKAAGTDTDLYQNVTLVILVNDGTASAAEIVAASLQDNGRAVLVGETTFGKGSVQSVLTLEQEAAIRLTTARYFTPSERVIHENGIDPDIRVPMSADVWRRVQMQRLREENPEFAREVEEEDADDPGDAVDVQLERALDMLKALLIFQGTN